MDFTEPHRARDAARGRRVSIAARFGHEYFADAGPDRRPRRRAVAGARRARASSGCTSPRSTAGAAAGMSELAIVSEELAAAGLPAAADPGVGRRSAPSSSPASAPTRRSERWLPRGSRGEKMVFAITEPDAGSNSHNLATTATRDGDVYRLSGTKTYISGVDEAAADARGRAHRDRARDRPRPAVAVRRRHRRARARPHADPGRDRRPGEAVPRCSSTTSRCPPTGCVGDRGRRAAPGVRRAQPRAHHRARRSAPASGGTRSTGPPTYAHEREVWGVPIGTHQGVAHPLAIAKIELELARLMTQKAAWMHDHADDRVAAGEAANMAKYAAAEAGAALPRRRHPDPRRQRHGDRVRPRRPLGHGAAAAHRAGEPGDDPQLRRPAVARPPQVVFTLTVALIPSFVLQRQEDRHGGLRPPHRDARGAAPSASCRRSSRGSGCPRRRSSPPGPRRRGRLGAREA